jgi:hypothetical protein
MFKIGRSELRGKRIEDIVTQEEISKILDAATTTEAVNGPHYLITPLKVGEEARCYEISISLLCDLHHNVTRIIVMVMREVGEASQVRVAV